MFPRKQRKTTENAREKYHSLYKEEKEKKQQYGREQYKNLPEDEKQKLFEYKKKELQNEKKCLIITDFLINYKNLFSFS